MTDPGPQPRPPQAPATGSPVLTAGGVVLAIAGLYLGQDIFVPFALAILLSFALTPLVDRLKKLRLPRMAAVIVAVAVAVVLIAGIAAIVGHQLVQLANNLPTYQTTISQKIRSLQDSAPGGSVLERVTSTVEDLSQELSGGDEADRSARGAEAGRPRNPDPITVRLERPEPQPLEIVRTIVGPLLAPLATAGLVVIFVIFVLLERSDLRDRFIKLAGAGDLQKSTHAINDAAARVSRYLLMQLVVNLTYGIPIGLALYFIGIPNAVLWGLLAAVLRFIPYLGPFLAALFPIALAIAVDPGWSMLFMVVGLFLVAELISNNIIEPWLYGSSTGLSSLAIIMAAIFWTTLWGPVGLFLSTPLTVCLVVIGRYVPQLEFLGVLLGSDPVLAAEERLYQRLLAGNLEEAAEIAEDYVDEKSSIEFYDNVALPALRLAENDRQRSTTDVNYRRVVADTAVCVVREIEDHLGAAESEVADAPVVDGGADGDRPVSVLCIAGRTELDRAAAEITRQALAEQGTQARVLPPIAVTQGALGQLDLRGVDVVCLSYLSPQPEVFARYICRRLRRRAPKVKLVVCCWNLPAETVVGGDLARRMSADAVFASLQACVDQVAGWAARGSLPGDGALLHHATEQKQNAAVSDLGPMVAGHPRIDELSRVVAERFGTPLALITLARPVRDDDGGSSSHEASLDAHVIAANEPLISEDVTQDSRFADDPLVLEKGIRFYAGMPLRTADGLAVGCLSVIDTQPRAFTEEEERGLARAAESVMRELEALART